MAATPERANPDNVPKADMVAMIGAAKTRRERRQI